MFLTLQGLGFPNYGSDKSKKNFRIIYYVTCEVDKVDEKDDPIKNAAGKVVTQEVTLLIEKPASKDCWQWKDSTENLYLPPIDGSTNPVELDLSRLRTNDFGFQSDNYRVTKFVGKLKGIRVQIYDVHDKSFGDYLRKVLAAVGVDAIKFGVGLIPGIPSALVAIAGAVGGVFLGDGKGVSDKVAEKDTEKKTIDKLLFGGYTDVASGDNSPSISGTKKWNGSKEGRYTIKFGIE